MSISKEWLQQTIAAMESQRDEAPFGISDDHDMTLEALKMALAGMEAEPYGYVHKELYESTGSCGLSNDHEAHRDSGTHIKLYTAPQSLTTSERAELENYRNAQLVVPEDFDSAWSRMKDDRFGCNEEWAKKFWDACRAAMQSGAVKDGWVACSERMPDIGVPVITCCGDVVQYAVYAWDAKEWQDWYEEYDKLPASTFTHWHPRPAAPQQEVNGE